MDTNTKIQVNDNLNNACSAKNQDLSIKPVVFFHEKLEKKIYFGLLLPFVLACSLLIFANLGAAKFLGDELNSIFFLKDSLIDYLKTFHYGHSIKLQFWTLHALFGNSFLHYRIPAAIASLATIVILFWPQKNYRPSLLALALVLPILSLNQSFLYFARWGMPIYAEGIFASALLILTAFPNLKNTLPPSWKAWQIALMAILIWIYPTTLLLLASFSLYYSICLAHYLIKNKKFTFLDLVIRLFQVSLPIITGLFSYALLRLSVKPEHWARARGHHINFSKWLSLNPGKSSLDFVLNAPVSLVNDLKMQTQSAMNIAPLVNGIFFFCLLAILLAPLLAWINLKNSNKRKFSKNFLQNYAFLFCIATASVSVSIFASLQDAFPAGKIRYLPFLLPCLSILSVISISFLERLLLAKQRVILLASVITCLYSLFAYSQTTAEVLKSYRHRALAESQMLELINQPSTAHVLAWRLGFFYPTALLPTHVSLDLNPHGILSSLTRQEAKKIQQNSKEKIILLSRTFEIGTQKKDIENKLQNLLAELNLKIEKHRSSDTTVVLVLGAKTK